MSGELRVKRVSNYVIDKQLGKGTFGDVKLATHVLTGEKVAIKILEKAKISREEDFNRVVREIQVLKMLNHSNIVKLLEVLDTPHHIFLVTQFVENGELFDYVVKRGKLTEQETCKFFRQLISAVSYCHLRRVCHRDLKLENILLNAANDLKIIDFGLSNILSQENAKFKTACGSPSYVAPEVLSGRKYHGPQVDIWSAGIILYAMLCGTLPFDDEELPKLYKKIGSGQFDIPPFVSASAADLLKKILVVDPEKRFDIKQIISHPWFVETLPEPYEPPAELDLPTLIDFRIVYTMTQAIPEWPGIKVIKALNGNRHNQTTATYYLLSEKRANSGEKKPWSFNEQQQYSYGRWNCFFLFTM
ncbi:Kinase [Hexamita inflata]|uniref:non-specific serine/threonine protein kinase n=1 Tax=Hexamita inflata TaxID=28002 RepID=A0AA86QX28_9EUKA|nr:CAMK CAMKL [Hexamita inflata]